MDDLRPDKENNGMANGRRNPGQNYEVYDSQQFDPKKGGVKKSFQNMKNILQKAKD